MNTYIIVSDFEDDEDGVLFWSNKDGWVDRDSATLFTEAERNDGLGLPLEAAGWVKASSYPRSMQEQFREHYPDGIDGDPDGIPTTGTPRKEMTDERFNQLAAKRAFNAAFEDDAS